MTSELSGTRVAFLTANEGVEQVELTRPRQAVKDAGGVVIADELRTVPGVTTFVQRIFEAGKPAAVICHEQLVNVFGEQSLPA